MYCKVMTISPEEAVLWLDTKNSRNRPVSQATVDRYSQEIKSGKWKVNGQPIIFGKSGNLLNGQHRLKAVAQTNKSIETLVVYGVDDDTFDTLDDNARRSLGDVFAIRGEVNAQILSAGIRFIWMYGTGQILAHGAGRSKIATKQLLEQTLDKHPAIRQSVKLFQMLKARPGGLLIPASSAVGLHYLFSLVNEKRADEFFTVLQSGFGLGEGHPVALLRARLIAGQSASSKLTDEARYFYTVTAWNAFAKELPLKRMALSGEEKSPDIEGLPKKLMQEFLTM